MALEEALDRLQQFRGSSLAATIADIESRLGSADTARVGDVNLAFGIDLKLLQSAIAVKTAAAQIDVVLHATAILNCLPYLLEEDEVVEKLSLGAGNAASDFDLETSRCIAEFKFIHWQGGSEAVRKKTLFQDFYKLVREPTAKLKYLYLLNTKIPLRFLRSKRDVLKVLDRNRRLADDFVERYGKTYHTVGEFYEAHKGEVRLVNLVDLIPQLDIMASVTVDEG